MKKLNRIVQSLLKHKFPVYPFIFPAVILLHNYNGLFGFIQVKYILAFLGIAVIVGFASYVVSNFIFRRSSLSALVSFFSLAFIFYFGYYHDMMKMLAKGTVISSYKIILPLSGLILFFLIRRFYRKSGSLSKFAGYLNLLMIVLLIVECIHFVMNLVKVGRNKNLIYSKMELCQEYNSSGQPDSLKPDIFYIVFDEYTNNVMLRKYWNFDNNHISRWLEKEGFLNLENSRANYNFTPFSVSSILNMNYIESNKGTKGDNPVFSLQAVRSFSSNETFCILEKENYSIHFLAPFYSSIQDIGLVHEFGDFSEKKLFHNTFFKRIEDDILWNFTNKRFIISDYGNREKRMEDMKLTIRKIKECTDSSSNRKPLFVYGHLMVTHDPHLFDSNGSFVPKWDSGSHSLKTYVQQVQYANILIKEIVEHIKRNGKSNTILIIQGDHGFRNLPSTDFADHFPIFNAVYFPNRNYGDFHDSLSSVNTLRIVFNEYFNQDYKLLKDSSILVKY